MVDPEKSLAKEWFLKARDDELSIKAIFKDDGPPNTICFLSQQMAEKYLKGYIAYKGKRFPKVHQLDHLVRLCERLEPKFSTLKDAADFLTTFYTATRYPGDYSEFGPREAKEAFEKALHVKDFVLNCFSSKLR